MCVESMKRNQVEVDQVVSDVNTSSVNVGVDDRMKLLESQVGYLHTKVEEIKSLNRQLSDSLGLQQAEVVVSLDKIASSVESMNDVLSSRPSFLGAIKIDLPLFYGSHDDYLEWERMVENLFSMLNLVKESEKVALSASCFRSSALIWWELVSNFYSTYWFKNIDTWVELREAMRLRFCGPNKFVDAKVKLLKCRQDGRSIRSYFEELEELFLNGGVDEDEFNLTERFLLGLDMEFKNSVEVAKQTRLYEAYYAALEVERSRESSFGWSSEVAENDGLIFYNRGADQRNSLFKTWCTVGWSIGALMVIDGGSSKDCISEEFCVANNIVMSPLLNPYKMHWVREDQGVEVTKRAFVYVEINGYSCERYFDVMSMTFCDILLGRPWQTDVNATHYCLRNCYVFSELGKRFVLEPMATKEFERVREKRRKLSANAQGREKVERVSQEMKINGHAEIRLEGRETEQAICMAKLKEACAERKSECGEGELVFTNSFVPCVGTKVDDSRTNPLKEGGDDENHVTSKLDSPIVEDGNAFQDFNGSFRQGTFLCKSLKLEKLDLDYPCDSEVVERAFVDHGYINFGDQTEGDVEIISAEEFNGATLNV